MFDCPTDACTGVNWQLNAMLITLFLILSIPASIEMYHLGFFWHYPTLNGDCIPLCSLSGVEDLTPGTAHTQRAGTRQGPER